MTKSISWLLENEDNFSILLGKLLLFDRNSPYFWMSGLVSGLRLISPQDEKMSVLQITHPINHKKMYAVLDREDLIKHLKACVEIIGNEESENLVIDFNH